MDTLLLKPEEAATQLRLSRATLYQLLASGRLQSVAVGRARRIPRKALHEFIERLADEQRRGSDAWSTPRDPAVGASANAGARALASAEMQTVGVPGLPRVRP